MKHKILLAMLLVCNLRLAFAEYDPTDDLLSAFGGSCSTMGSLSSQALSQSASLKGIIEQVRDDPSCQGVAGILSNLDSSLNPSLLQSSTIEEQDYQELSSQINDLELALQAEQAKPAAVQDLMYISTLQAALGQKKIDQITSKNQPNRDRLRRRMEAVKNFQQYSTQLFAALRSSNRCLTNNPNLFSQVGAQLLGLSSSFAKSGVVGSVMLGIGSIAENFISFFRDSGLSSKIKDVVNNRMNQAVGCSLEGMAKTYCEARDLQAVIDREAASSEDNPCANKKWQGAELFGRDLAPFLQWVSRLTAGSKSAGTAQSTEKKAGIDLRASFEKLSTDIDGMISRTEKLTKAGGDETTETKSLLRSISNMVTAQTCNGYTCTTALPGLFVDDPGCGAQTFFYTRGASRVCPRIPGQGNNESCDQCIQRNNYAPLRLSEVRGLTDRILSEGGQSIARQISLVKESDPQLVLTLADQKAENRRAPRDFLEGAKAYLQYLLDEQNSIAKGSFRKTIESALSRVNTSLDRLDHPTASATDDVSAIADQVSPGGDTYVLSNQITAIVKQDLDDKLAKGKMDKDLETLVQLSVSDSVGSLIQNYFDLDTAAAQAREARNITKRNLDAVSRVFEDQIDGSLAQLFKEAKSDPDAGASLSLNCIRTLLIPTAPADGRFDLNNRCKGREYKGVGSGLKMRFDDLAKKPFPERVCSIYDFFRKARLNRLNQTKGAR